MRRIIGIIAATCGVVLLVTEGRLTRLTHLTFSEGDLWMLVQAACFALYSILVRMKPEELHPLTFLFSLFVLGILSLLPWFTWGEWGMATIAFSPTIIGAILYLGVGPSLLAYLCWNESVAIIGPTRTAFVYYCLPLFSGGEAVVLLGEPFRAVHVLGGILIMAGVILSTRE